MDLITLNIAVLVVSLTGLISQLFVKNKQTSHLLFAIFCGSVAMMTTKRLSGDSLGAYQYLIGMGACATCNCYWLLSRSLFRSEKAIELRHIAVAVVIAGLIMLNQGLLFATSLWTLPEQTFSLFKVVLSELTILLSSCILVLTLWEACRGFSTAKKTEQQQRILFIATFAFAVSISKVAKGYFADSPQSIESVIAAITLLVLLSTQIQLLWKFKPQAHAIESNNVESLARPKESETITTLVTEDKQTNDHDLALTQQVHELLIDKQSFLQANLKVGDIAKQLDVPEYKVSKVLRQSFNAKNFNQYVNQLRIEHAKRLLADPNNKQWSVLVVSLESGFASVGPFTRAFKSITGATPNQYRQQLEKQTSSLC